MKIKKEYSIAVLVLSGIALTIFGVNYLKGLDLLQRRQIYHVVYNDVTGITGASPVYYHGLKVGQVIETRMVPDGSGHIAISFQLADGDLLLKRDARIKIYSADLFSRALQVVQGSGTELAVSGDTLSGDVELSLTDAVGEQIDPLKRKAEGMLASVDSLLNSLQHLLNDSTIGDIDASFSIIRSTVENFNTTSRRIDELVIAETQAIHATLASIRSIAANLEAHNAGIGRIVTNMDSISSAFADGRLQRMTADLAESSAKLKGLMTGLEQGEGSLGALLKNDTLYQNLENASRELDLLLEDLRLNPNRYVHMSVFGRKDKMPKLTNSDIERIKRSIQDDPRK